MATTHRIRANTLVMASDFLNPVSRNLDQSVTVTNFVLEDNGGKPVLEFEIRVKKIGTVPVPRNTKPGAALG